MAAASGVFACPSGWTQDDSYRKGRSSRAERGFVQPVAWSERPKPSRDTSSVSYEKAPRFRKEKGGTGIGKRQGRNRSARGAAGESPASLSPVGFRPPLTWRPFLLMLVRGRRSLWKKQRRILSPALSDLSAFALSVIRGRSPAAAERQERSLPE